MLLQFVSSADYLKSCFEVFNYYYEEEFRLNSTVYMFTKILNNAIEAVMNLKMMQYCLHLPEKTDYKKCHIFSNNIRSNCDRFA